MFYIGNSSKKDFNWKNKHSIEDNKCQKNNIGNRLKEKLEKNNNQKIKSDK